MELLYFILTAYGLTQILVYGKIFDKIRPSRGQLGIMFHCPMCMGFWVGVFLFFVSPLTELFNFEFSLVNAFICGFLSSGTSYILNMVFGDDGINIYKKEL